MPRLQLNLPGQAEPLALALTTAVVSLGRRESNLLRVDDPSVSGAHAVFTRRADGDYMLEDLGSTNGSRINGKGVDAPTRLRNGDRVRFGKVEGTYASEVSPDTADVEAVIDPGDTLTMSGTLADPGATVAMPAPRPSAASEPSATINDDARGVPAEFATEATHRFSHRDPPRDPVQTALYGLAALAILALLAAVAMSWMMSPPSLAL